MAVEIFTIGRVPIILQSKINSVLNSFLSKIFYVVMIIMIDVMLFMLPFIRPGGLKIFLLANAKIQ